MTRQTIRTPMSTALATLMILGGVAVGSALPSTAVADEVTHEIQKSAPAATLGVPAKASVTVQGKNGWHVNEEAPITLTVKSDPGLDVPKAKQARADLAQSSKDSARFDIPFSASAAGKKNITAEAKFVMCQEQACKPVKETVSLEISVAAATPPNPVGGIGKAKKSPKSP